MEPRENPNPTSPQEDTPNPNPQPKNINMEIDASLRYIRTLIQDLENIGYPLHLSLATSLDTIVSSIANVQGQLTHIFYYKGRIYKYCRIDIDKNEFRDLKISKQDLMTLFIDPSTRLQPLVTKRCICMD